MAKLFFAYGLGNAMYFPLSVGATSILWPGPPSAAAVYDIIERHRPTLLFSVPTNYGMLLAHESGGARDFDLSSVRLAVSAGEALADGAVRALQAALRHRDSRRHRIRPKSCTCSSPTVPGRVRPGSSGELVPGYEARLVDETGAAVATGEMGNLLIKGDSTCAVYWNQHERTKATIEGHWIRTGDKYHQDADGYFWHAGRADDMLKVGGIWVSPVEVENALDGACGGPGVRGGRPSRSRSPGKAGGVRGPEPGRGGSPALASELQQFVRDRLADYKRPRWIHFVPELPKTATGKTQRFKLRDA